MYAPELGLSVVHEVRSTSEGEIYDVDAVYLPDFLVSLPSVDVFCHQLGRSEQHALEVGVLVVVLYLEEQQFSRLVLRQQVHAVVLVVFAFLVAFALQQSLDDDFLLHQCGHEPFEHREVRFVSQQAFHGPVKTDVVGHGFSSSFWVITVSRSQSNGLKS